jgi:hypothetical protein
MNKNTRVSRVVSRLKKISSMALCSAGISIMSCLAPKTSLPYTLSDNYKTANLSTRLLVITLPAIKNIVIANPKDVIDDYGGVNATPESRIQKFYLPMFVETFKSFISGDTLMVADGYRSEFSLRDFEKKQIDLKTDSTSSAQHFLIPTKPAMQKAGLDSAVVIVIDRLTFKRNKFYYEYYWDTNTKQPANLEATADLVIWDYKNDTPVFWGAVTKKVDFQIAMSRRQWDESARALAKKIILSIKCL